MRKEKEDNRGYSEFLFVKIYVSVWCAKGYDNRSQLSWPLTQVCTVGKVQEVLKYRPAYIPHWIKLVLEIQKQKRKSQSLNIHMLRLSDCKSESNYGKTIMWII